MRSPNGHYSHLADAELRAEIQRLGIIKGGPSASDQIRADLDDLIKKYRAELLYRTSEDGQEPGGDGK